MRPVEVVKLIKETATAKCHKDNTRHHVLTPGNFINVGQLLDVLTHTDAPNFKEVFSPLFDARVRQSYSCDTPEKCTVPSKIVEDCLSHLLSV